MLDLTIDKNTEITKKTVPPVKSFYQVVWRWHFYAGLFVIPFMLMLAVTGIIYLFKPQLDAMLYRNLLFVPVQTKSVSADEQAEAVYQKYPNSVIKSYTPNASADRSSQFDITTENGQNLFVFVKPFTAEVLGDYDADRNLQAYAVLLHGELMIGKVGDSLIELAACWALVLLVSGFYLWFPRGGSKIWGVFLPRLRTKNKRIFWRDLHAVPGFYALIIITFMILTGLPWTGFWGEKFASVWTKFPDEKNGTAFKSETLTGSLNSATDKKVAWAVEQMPYPESKSVSGHEHHASITKHLKSQTNINQISLDSIVENARERDVMPGYSIMFPKNESGVFTISAPINDPLRQSTIHLDQYTGKVLADVRWKDYGMVPKAVTFGISVHEGLYFGLPNQFLILFAALSVILLSISGIILWWRRRPAKRLGAPPLPENLPLWKTAAVIICVMGILFPFVGISLILILLIDYLIIQRVTWLKQLIN